MKTVVQKSTGISKIVCDNNVMVSIQGDSGRVIVGGTLISDTGLTFHDAVTYSDVIPPLDWVPDMYLFDGSIWELNPSYEPPTTTTTTT